MTVSYENNPVANNLMQDVAAYRPVLLKVRDDLRAAYWKHHAAIAEASFSVNGDQTVALRKLGQLAEALGRAEAAYTAVAHVGCWLD
jgi:hypothetical protein